MHINNNVQKIAIENILNQIGEVYTKIGDEVILYPLKIVSGITNFTENGQFKVNYNIDKFTSNVGIISSNEPIVCYWEGAYKSYVPTDILGANYQLKDMSAENGRKINTWIMQYSTELIESEQNINNNSYTAIVLNRNIRSFSTDWVPTDNEMKYYLYLYVDKKAKSPQFLKMVSKEPRYLPGGKLAGCEMSFINLNQAYSQSGKDILNFVKMTHPGGNYPFPKEITTEEGTVTILDYDRLNNRGVNDIQLQFWNSYWLNSIIVYGAPKSNWKITAPRRLLLCNPHPPISSSLDIDGSALNNYYAVFEAQTLYKQFWDTWKSKVQTYYDYTAQKKFMGGWRIKSGHWSDVVDTNPVADDTSTYNMWNNWSFRTPIDSGETHKDITFNTPETAFTDTSITFDKDTPYRPEDFLNHNGFIFSAMEALPMEFTETTRYTLGDFGALGRILQGFVQIFTAGFNPGWTTNNTWVPNKSVNFLIPTTTFDFGRAMTSSGEGSNDPIPFDCVNPEFTAGGNKTVVCGYRYQLTRYFQSPSQARDTDIDGEGHNGIWDTKYLGQSKWEDGTWIFDNHEPVKWKSDCKAISPIERDEEYEVFLVSYKGIGLTTCRMTFYNYINHDASNVESVWESIQLTNAKFKNDLTLWTNTYKLNFSEEMNNEGLIDYPTNVVPPSPTENSIRISDFEKAYNKDLNPTLKEIKQPATDYASFGNGINWFWLLKQSGTPLATGPLNVFYCLNNDFKNIVSTDLSKKIGVGKLNDYRSFTFKFISKPGENYEFKKDITINISDLVDNQWTPIKIADISEIANFAGGDPFPRNKDKFNVTGEYYCYGDYNQRFNFAPVSSDIFTWIKLNKTSQFMEIAFDNPTNEIIKTQVGEKFESFDNVHIDQGQVWERTIEFDVNVSDVQNSKKKDIFVSIDSALFESGGRTSISIDNQNRGTPTIRLKKSALDNGGIQQENLIQISCGGGISGVRDIVFNIKKITSQIINNKYHISLTLNVKEDWNKAIDISHMSYRIRLYTDYFEQTAFRSYTINQNIVPQTIKYNDICFFRGYEIKDFYINPNI